MSIDITWPLREWTDADSEALDQFILAERARKAATRRTSTKRPDNCTRCNKPLRGPSDPKTPGTVSHKGRGYCTSCYPMAQIRGEF